MPRNEEELNEIKRLPDCVRDLQIFEGNPVHYVSWVHNVESILSDYEVIKHKPLYRAILHHVRQKIRGPADSALIAYNIFDENWETIKECLSLHYADKRGIQSLEHQLITMRQGRDTIDQYYAKVNHQLSLIINKIKTDQNSVEGMRALIESYRDRALDVFIRGLQQHLARFIKVQKPKNLPEAYSACLELQNMDFRKSNNFEYYENDTITTPTNELNQNQSFHKLRRYQERQPSFSPAPKPLFNSGPKIFPNTTTPKQQQHNFNNQNTFPPPRPTQPKPPVPMDVDPSIRSAKINYMNRPTPK